MNYRGPEVRKRARNTNMLFCLNLILTQTFFRRGQNTSSAVLHDGQLKCDVTRAETIFRLSAKQTIPFKSAGGRQFSRLLAAEVCASAVVMLDTPYSDIV